MTFTCDPKHSLCKRTRTHDKSRAGFISRQIGDVLLTRHHIRRVFEAMGLDWQRLMSPDDEQNVTEAMGFIDAMVRLSDVDVVALGLGDEYKHIELQMRLLGDQYTWIRTAYFDRTSSVQDSCLAISKLQASFLQCYRHAIASLPRVLYDGVAYRSVGGHSMCCEANNGNMAPAGAGEWHCRFASCGKVSDHKALRTHVAQHVLKLNRECPGHNTEPCGFCGDHTSGCIAMVTEINSTTGAKCAPKACSGSCKNGNGYEFGIKSAEKVTKSTPSSNVPIKCPICPGERYVWKYNWRGHLHAHHPIDSQKSEWLEQAQFKLSIAPINEEVLVLAG